MEVTFTPFDLNASTNVHSNLYLTRYVAKAEQYKSLTHTHTASYRHTDNTHTQLAIHQYQYCFCSFNATHKTNPIKLSKIILLAGTEKEFCFITAGILSLITTAPNRVNLRSFQRGKGERGEIEREGVRKRVHFRESEQEKEKERGKAERKGEGGARDADCFKSAVSQAFKFMPIGCFLGGLQAAAGRGWSRKAGEGKVAD